MGKAAVLHATNPNSFQHPVWAPEPTPHHHPKCDSWAQNQESLHYYCVIPKQTKHEGLVSPPGGVSGISVSRWNNVGAEEIFHIMKFGWFSLCENALRYFVIFLSLCWFLLLGFWTFMGLFWTTPGNAQSLLLVLCSGITPDIARETIWNTKDQTWVGCMECKYPTNCTNSGPWLCLYY